MTEEDLLDAPMMDEEPQEEPRGMSEDDAKEAAKEIIKAARDYAETELHPALEKAWHYYYGNVWADPMWPVCDEHDQPLLDENTGQPIFEGSSVVVTICWDTVHAVLPEMYRVFTSTNEIVEFAPESGDDVDMAKQATAYCNQTWRKNAGEDVLNPAMIDYLVKFVAFRVSWQDETEFEQHQFSGLDEASVTALSNDESVVELDAQPVVQMLRSTQQDPETGAMMPVEIPLVTYDGTLTRQVPKGRLAIETIPQEELIVDGSAKCINTARCVGQWGEKIATDVIATGIEADTVMAHVRETASDDKSASVTRARSGDDDLRVNAIGTLDPALSFVTYIEALIRLDVDGDGIAESYHVVALGDEAEVVTLERRDDVHYIVDSPYERPHKIVGDGVVERTMDLQDMATALYRRIMDNLNRACNPREVLVGDDDGSAMADLQSVFKGPISLPMQASLTTYAVPFVAQQAFPVMEYIEARAASRTGISMAGQGLDPDVLKSQTVESAAAIVSAPQSRIEYLIRRFAIGVLRNVFKSVLKLSVMHQNQPQMIRMRSEWVPVEPMAWNASMDATPNVGLGTGTKAEKLAALGVVLAQQKEALAAGLPIVTINELRRTLGQMAEAAGLKDDEAYFKELSEEELAQAQQQAQEQAMQAQQMQAQAEMAKETAKANAKAQVDMQRAQIDQQAKLQEMQAQWQIDQEKMQLEHRLRMEALDAEVRREIALIQMGSGAGQGNLRRSAFM